MGNGHKQIGKGRGEEKGMFERGHGPASPNNDKIEFLV